MKETKRTVMVVDDDRDYLAQMRMRLETAGYNVIIAEGEAEAEEVLKKTRPDIAIVDLMMENMDGGFVLCHRIKKLDRKIPVILVTSVSAETGIEFDAVTSDDKSWLKADVLLTKPARFEQLKREMDRLLAENA